LYFASKREFSRLFAYLVPVSVIVYLFWSASLFSDSFEQTQMRLIDDYAMQYSIYSLQTNILNGNIPNTFFQFDYAYGWLFWISFALLTLPFRYFFNLYGGAETESLLIISVRSINIFILIFLAIVIFRIIQKTFSKTDIQSNFPVFLLSASLMLSPAIGYWAGRPMPPLFSTCLLALGILVGLADYRDKPKRPYLVGLILGLAVGIKINYIIFVPVIVLLIMLIRRNLYHDRFEIKKLIIIVKIGCSAFLGFLIAASPALIINPIEAFPRYITIFNLFKGLSVSEQAKTFGEFWTNFTKGVVFSGYGPAVHITVFILLILLTLDKYIFSKKYNVRSSILWIGFTILLLQLFLSFYLGAGVVYVQSYTLPLLSLVPIFLAVLINIFHTRPVQATAASLAFFVMTSFNLVFTVIEKDVPIPNIDTYQQMFQNDVQSGRFTLQKKMQDDIPLTNSSIDIIQDNTLPTAWSGFRTGVNLTYSYDDWHVKTLTISTNTLYLFLDKSKHKIDISKKDEAPSIEPTYSDSDREAHKILRTLKFGNRSCELRSEDQNYVLLKCNP
jgi:hypothetical protein